MEIDRTLLSRAHQRLSARAGGARAGGAQGGPPRGDRGVAGHRQPADRRLWSCWSTSSPRAWSPAVTRSRSCAAARRPPTTTTSCAAADRTRSSWAPRSPTRASLRDCDVVVEVCNGMPFLAPLWCRKPMVLCMVNHVHTDLWALRFPPPLSTVGRFVERRGSCRRGPPPQPGADGVRVDGAGTSVARRAPPDASACSTTGSPRSARRPRGRPSRCSWRSVGSPSTSASTCCSGCGSGAPGSRRTAGHRGRGAPACLPGVAGRTRGDIRRAGQRNRKASPAGIRLAARAFRVDRRLGHRGHRGRPAGHPYGRFRRAGTAGFRRTQPDRPAGPHRGGIRLGVGGAGPGPGAPLGHGRGRAAACLSAHMVDRGAALLRGHR